MITITGGLGRNHIRVEGHARSTLTPSGVDLVCCAVSTLIMALLYTLRKISGVHMAADVREGYADVAAYPGKGCTHDEWVEAQSRVQMARDGLLMLAQEYPAYIRVHPPDEGAVADLQGDETLL